MIIAEPRNAAFCNAAFARIHRPCARKMDNAEQMAEIMNKAIADAAEAEARCERLAVQLTEAEAKCDEANIAAERYRLARDFLLTFHCYGNPLQTVAYANFMETPHYIFNIFGWGLPTLS